MLCMRPRYFPLLLRTQRPFRWQQTISSRRQLIYTIRRLWKSQNNIYYPSNAKIALWLWQFIPNNWSGPKFLFPSKSFRIITSYRNIKANQTTFWKVPSLSIHMKSKIKAPWLSKSRTTTKSVPIFIWGKNSSLTKTTILHPKPAIN